MITRSHGMGTGTGYIVGGGYDGKTKELDAAVLEAANLMQATFGVDVVIRFNSNRESGGAFIKDNKMSSMLGIGAGLYSSAFKQMSTEEIVALSYKELQNLPLDYLSFHAVLDKSLMIAACEGDIHQSFDSAEAVLKWLKDNTDETELKAYLGRLPAKE